MRHNSLIVLQQSEEDPILFAYKLDRIAMESGASKLRLVPFPVANANENKTCNM